MNAFRNSPLCRGQLSYGHLPSAMGDSGSNRRRASSGLVPSARAISVQSWPLMRAAVDDLFRAGQGLSWGIPATGVLVETLLDRTDEGDVTEARNAIDRLVAAPGDQGFALREIWLLRLRALLARVHGDDEAYRELKERYRDMAMSLGFEGHMAWVEAM